MNDATTSERNIFTCLHEPRGFLVQSQGNGKWMILCNRSGSWERVAQDFDGYVEACGVADRLL